jgi:hypothetical protein
MDLLPLFFWCFKKQDLDSYAIYGLMMHYTPLTHPTGVAQLKCCIELLH